MSARKLKILSEFQGFRRLAKTGIAVLALGFPATAMATAEHPRGFSLGNHVEFRGSRSDSGMSSFGASRAGRSSRSGEEGDLEITLNHPQEAAIAFAKSVLATSLFRHFDEWQGHAGDHDDERWERRHHLAELLLPHFAWHWKRSHSDCIPPIPEPGTGLLLAMGLVTLASRRRR